MSDAKDKNRKQAPDNEAEGPLCGERLAEARRIQQISVLEIAKELHLDEPKVRALERNEFDVLGAPVFAKGHLRKYAQLVQVSDADVMADYYQLNRTSGMPLVVSVRPPPRREMSPGPWIAVIVVIILVATAYWWFTSTPASVDEPARDLLSRETSQSADLGSIEPIQPMEPMEPEVDDSANLVSALTDTDNDVGSQDPGGTDAATTDNVAPPAAVVSEAPALDSGQMRLLVTYNGDCWTEITDAVGRRLFFGLGKDGRTVELSGQAPFNVLFGNAENVRLEVNGSERAITAAERRGRIARLTIAGS